MDPAQVGEGRVRLRLLLLQRWVAIGGQLVTVLGVHFVLGLHLELIPILSLIALSATLNTSAIVRLGQEPWLRDRAAFSFIVYDVVQLVLMLLLTGGLLNPFALLMLAPVTVAAAILSRPYVIMVTTTAIIGLCLLWFFYRPLPWAEPFELPGLYKFAIWFALVLACLFMAIYVFGVAEESRRLNQALTETKLALNREQKASALGALAASAAHELGSPLGTIAVIASDLLDGQSEPGPLRDDLVLLKEQVARCRRILTELSQAREPADGEDPFRFLKLTALVDAIAAPCRSDTISFEVVRIQGGREDMPTGERTPELIHGLSNIITNAMQFAHSRVVAECGWDDAMVMIRIRDDGPGFPPGNLSRLGEPFRSTRAGHEGHMGLGLFIAQTLLGHTGAVIRFYNEGGAVVEMTWPRRVFERAAARSAGAPAGAPPPPRHGNGRHPPAHHAAL